MRPLVLFTALVVASVAASGAMAGKPATQDHCFLTRDLRGRTLGADGHTLYLGVNGVDTYQVTTSDPCLAHATDSDPILVKDFGLGMICRPLDLQIIVRGNRCVIDKLTKLTPEQASALPKRLQP